MVEKKIMLGNAAIARGAYEAGVKVSAAYPGTPSTEISENMVQYKDVIYSEWSPNEKVATEVAIGASFAGGTCKFCGKLFHFLVEIPPALMRTAHYDLVLNAGHRGLCLVHLLQYILVVQTYHGVDLCTVSAVDQVFLCQLQRARNQNGTDLVQSHCTNPVLPTAAENQHDNSSLFDAYTPHRLLRLSPNLSYKARFHTI